jgi:PAS domain S-box-containing protein
MKAEALGGNGAAEFGRPTITATVGELIADLAVSADSAILWSFDVSDNSVRWLSGMDNALGVTAATPDEIRTLLTALITPLIDSARGADPWEDFQREQSFETRTGETHWLRTRARTFAAAHTRGLLGIATDVTERQADRRNLADLADRYRLLVELSPDAICVHEAGQVKYVNPATLRFLGAENGDLMGNPIGDFVAAESIPDVERRIASLEWPGAASEPAEVVLKRVDGGTVTVESVSVRTTWEGRPAFQVIMRDVTAQKAAEAARHYQAALVSHVSDAVIATSSSGVVTSWNPAAESVYGLSAAQAVGRVIGEAVGAPLNPERVLHAGGVLRSTHRRSDGSALAIRVSAAEMNGGYVILCADETARRRAENHFSTVIASLDEGVVVMGPTGNIESANPAAQRILGMSEAQLVGLLSSSLELFDEAGNRVLLYSCPAPKAGEVNKPEHQAGGAFYPSRRPERVAVADRAPAQPGGHGARIGNDVVHGHHRAPRDR